ncbi:MAG: hypothetical protein KGZ65_00120 [Sphingomonadales bacterium]|nr:hypothetical protein [Sphingomonadaceae bacterium]MBS3929611.1 hypothetical protein [Sphingomonadales bacterium]
MTDATAVAQAADELRAAARVHKRSAAASRQKARELMQKAEELEAFCRDAGITIQTQPRKAESHDDN